MCSIPVYLVSRYREHHTGSTVIHSIFVVYNYTFQSIKMQNVKKKCNCSSSIISYDKKLLIKNLFFTQTSSDAVRCILDQKAHAAFLNMRSLHSLKSMSLSGKIPYDTFNELQKLINNSWAKHKENHSREGVFICDKTRRFSQNFCLDFLGLYNIYIENSFVNKVTRWV